MKRNFSKRRTLLLFASYSLMLLSLTSCSSDDDNDTGNTDVPKYESLAAKYDVTDTNAAYKSFEFTNDGYYIIETSTAVGAKSNYSSKMQLAKKASPRTRSIEYSVLFGSFSYDSTTGMYTLDKLGTIKITNTIDGGYSIEFVNSDGSTTTYTASKEDNAIADNDNTTQLCRTWNLTYIKETIKKDGEVVHTFSGTRDQWVAYQNQSADEDDYDDTILSQAIFTKSGTLVWIGKYQSGESEAEIRYWKWQNEADNVLLVTEDLGFDSYDKIDWQYADILKVNFDGSRLIMNETYDDDSYEYAYEFTFTN